MELTKAEQTPEAHAFLYKRTEEKFHALETITLQIAESETEQAKDRIEVMRFLRQVYEDQYSLFMYGPSQFLSRDTSAGYGDVADILSLFGREKEATNNVKEQAEDDSNAVF